MTFKPDPLQTHAKAHNRLSPKRKAGVEELDIPVRKKNEFLKEPNSTFTDGGFLFKLSASFSF